MNQQTTGVKNNNQELELEQLLKINSVKSRTEKILRHPIYMTEDFFY